MRRLAALPRPRGRGAHPWLRSAEIVKAPTGEQSRLTVNAATMKTLKQRQGHVAVSGAAKGPAELRAALQPLALGLRDARGRRRLLRQEHRHQAAPRQALGRRGPPAAGHGHDQQRLRHGADRQRADQGLHRSGAGAPRRPSANLQQIDGYKLKLTQAGANYVNRGLKQQDAQALQPVRHARRAPDQARGAARAAGAGTRRRSDTPGQGDTPGGTATINPGFLGLLPGGGKVTSLIPPISQDLDGDGSPDVGVVALPLEGATFDADTRTGTIQLGGGLVIDLPRSAARSRSSNPEIVIGADDAQRPLRDDRRRPRQGRRHRHQDAEASTSPTARSRSTTSTSRSAAR